MFKCGRQCADLAGVVDDAPHDSRPVPGERLQTPLREIQNVKGRAAENQRASALEWNNSYFKGFRVLLDQFREVFKLLISVGIGVAIKRSSLRAAGRPQCRIQS